MPAGRLDTYDLTVGVIVDMSEAIYLYSPQDLPLLTGVGADGTSIITSSPVEQIEYSWQDETNLAPRSALAASLTAAQTTITLASNDERLKFSTGDVLTISKAGVTDDETILITAYGTTAGTLTVTRAIAGTASAYVTNDKVIGLGTMLAEGSDPEDFRAKDRVKRTNCTQIFGPTKIEMSGTALVVPRYGVRSEWAHQLRHRMYEDYLRQEQALQYGRYYNSTTSSKRTHGGMAEFIDTNQNATLTEFNVTNIETMLNTVYAEGANFEGYTIMVNHLATKDLNNTNDTARVRQEIVDSRRGRQRVTVVMTEHGDVTIARNRWTLTRDAWGFRRENLNRRVMRPTQFERLAKTGDSEKAQIVCESGFEVVGERHCFRMTALSY